LNMLSSSATQDCSLNNQSRSTAVAGTNARITNCHALGNSVELDVTPDLFDPGRLWREAKDVGDSGSNCSIGLFNQRSGLLPL
jgi:hypothetical protein